MGRTSTRIAAGNWCAANEFCLPVGVVIVMARRKASTARPVSSRASSSKDAGTVSTLIRKDLDEVNEEIFAGIKNYERTTKAKAKAKSTKKK